MNRTKSLATAASLALSASALMAGCYSTPYGGGYYSRPAYYGRPAYYQSGYYQPAYVAPARPVYVAPGYAPGYAPAQPVYVGPRY